MNTQKDVLIQSKGEEERHVSTFTVETESQLQDKATHAASEQIAVQYVLPEDENLIR